ncbi:peptidylprolyl isomerase [uncultured Clostridium sp.]|uniref:peptidylprolyl isomerase n=1 Tax=uncultured Clostridium sp. TaxID=59620 RepID=UPI0025F4EC3A|nr:peptidylprolyl isomerase [uncultured Clostridium sp.]
MKKFIKIITVILCIIPITLIGCGNQQNKSQENKESTEMSDKNKDLTESSENLPVATIEVEGYGTIKAELYPEVAPNTVNNFIYLANSGFYDNLTFHRVIKNFMIQGGDPDGNGTGGPGYTIEGEFTSNGIANSLKHTEGVLSMARAKDPDSAGSQFFIMTKAASHLDGDYAAFGKVISGMDVVNEIENVKTDSNDKPKDGVVIKSIHVDTNGVDYPEPVKIK